MKYHKNPMSHIYIFTYKPKDFVPKLGSTNV